MDTVLPSVSIQELGATLATPGAPLAIDVRRVSAFDEDTATIPGALRGAPDEIERWLGALPRSRPIVAYCVHGQQVSQGAARRLIGAGLNARFLMGGITD